MRYLGLMLMLTRVLLSLLMLGTIVAIGATCANGQTLEERFAKSLQEATSQPISVEILPELEPVPDPISSPPAIAYAAAGESASYYVKFFTAPWCGSCQTFKQLHLAELEAEYPVTMVDIVEHPDWAAHVDRLPAFWLCRLSDLQPVAKFTGDVTVAQLLAAEPAIASVDFAPRSLETLAAALAWHCLQDEDVEFQISNFKSQFFAEPTFGSLLDIDADVPDVMLDLGRTVLIAQKMDFPAAGVSLDWTGKTRTVTIVKNRIDVKPGVAMTVRKFGLRKSCSLDAVTYNDALTVVTFELTGFLDLTVNLK